MNKCTLYAFGYMTTFLLLAGYLHEWVVALEYGGLSYGCGEETPIFTVYDAVKVFVSAVIICVWGIIGVKSVVRTCAAVHESKTSNIGDE